MIRNMNNNSGIELQQNNLEGEIFDMQILFSFLFRNKRLISLVSGSLFIISILYSLTLKKTWQGEFQIVLNSDQKSKTIISSNPSLQNLLGAQQNNLNTQVGILESPSVLMPIFKMVNENKGNQLIFRKWKNNLKIQLKPRTTILNISYRDKDKDLILPVLDKMSSVYQDYSIRSEKRVQQLTKDYLINQVDIFKLRSFDSLKKAQKFAIEQDLTFEEFYQDSSSLNENNKNGNDLNINPLLIPNIDLEQVRAQSANELRMIDMQLKKIAEIADDPKKLQFLGSTIPALVKEGLPQELSKIEEELVKKRTIYTENDPVIKNTLKRRDLLINLLKERSIGLLKAQRLKIEARMLSAMRPKGVFLEYKKLIRQAKRDESTLILLENQLRMIELEQAKFGDPWQLITEPTLLKDSVAPSKSKIATLALLIGFFVGSLIAYAKEKKSGFIFDLKTLQDLLSVPLLEKIDNNDNLFNKKNKVFLKGFLQNKSNNQICFISLNKEDIQFTSRIRNFLIKENDFANEINIINSLDDLNSILDSKVILLFISLQSAKFEDIAKLKDKLTILNCGLTGFVLLNYKI